MVMKGPFRMTFGFVTGWEGLPLVLYRATPEFPIGMGAMVTVLYLVIFGFMLSWVEMELLLYGMEFGLIAIQLENGRSPDYIWRPFSAMTTPASQERRTSQPHHSASLVDLLACRAAPTGAVAASTIPRAWRISSSTIATTRWGRTATWPAMKRPSNLRLR